MCLSLKKIQHFYNIINKKKNLKKLIVYLLMNFIFMFVEVFYGLISNSLSLLSDGAHMLLDCSAIIIGIYSSYLTEFPPNKIYEFGYLRSEVLGSFINSVFLLFIAIYIFFESIERFISPKEIHSHNLILISFLGLIVNIIGLFLSHDHSEDDEENEEKKNLINNENTSENINSIETSLDTNNNENKKNEYEKIIKNDEENENIKEEKNHIHHHHHKNDNLYAIYIHILADTLGSVAVLISSLLIKYHGFKISDPICSLIISFMIVYSIIPVLKNSTFILLHIPNFNLEKKKNCILDKCNEFSGLGFVVKNIDIWELKSNKIICDIQFYKNLNMDLENRKRLYKCLNDCMNHLKIKEFYIDI